MYSLIALVTIAIVCSSYITVSYSYLNLTILDFPQCVELAFSSPLFLFMCAFVFQLSC